MDEEKIFLVRDYDPKLGGEMVWLGLPSRTSYKEAQRVFQTRYGHPPSAVRRIYGTVLVGPADADVEQTGRSVRVSSLPDGDDD
jgi:hypothetical protein